jgi:hypothetical protein
MPADSLLLSIAVILVFLAFAVVLAWADYRTGSWLRSQAAAKVAPAEPRKQAA